MSRRGSPGRIRPGLQARHEMKNVSAEENLKRSICAGSYSVGPPGLVACSAVLPHGLRRGLHSFALCAIPTRIDCSGTLPVNSHSDFPFLMIPITALVHAHNDALRIGRCLETLHPCDEIVIVDHGSEDKTLRVAREYGARIVEAAAEGFAIGDLWGGKPERKEWILCLDPNESLSDSLAASLFEWKSEGLADSASAYSFFLREETAGGWVENPVAQTRLVPANWQRWEGRFPRHDESALALEGELLRFVLP